MSSFMADISSLGAEAITAKKSTSRANNTEMKMEDFLKLMVVQLQSQTIDDTADTGEMLNQLVQMQMVTALSNMTDASVMSYASSLVGKEVTIATVDKDNNLVENVLTVIGTGVYGGQQVIFCDDGEMYQLNQIMAVGRVPERKEDEEDPAKGDNGPDYPVTDVDKETKERVDALSASIIENPDAFTVKASDAGAEVKAPESAQESSNDADTANNRAVNDPLAGGLLDGMLTRPDYDGTLGAPTDET